nr:4711_t:CDS:2 [Entrophospora candida]
MDIQGDGTKNMNGVEMENDFEGSIADKKCGMIISTENVEESKEINESKKGIDSKYEHDIEFDEEQNEDEEINLET